MLKVKRSIKGRSVLGFFTASVIFASFTGCNQNAVGVSNNPMPGDQAYLDQVVDEGSYYRFSDDMIFHKDDPKQMALLKSLIPGKTEVGKSAQASYVSVSRWPGGYVPYYFEGGWSAAEKAVCQSAMNRYRSVCNLTFRETSARGSYILKMGRGQTQGCYAAGQSTIGYNASPEITISPDQIKYDVILHELGHTLGFMHEHQRPDRDSYINVNYSNIQPVVQFAFNKMSSANYNTSYDIYSIMHYRSYSSSNCVAVNTSQPFITTKSGATIDNKEFSGSDINGLRSTLGWPMTSTHFSTIYRPSTASEYWIADWTRNDFLNKVNQMAQSGYKVKTFDVYVVNNTELYYAEFEYSTASEYGILGWNRTDFINKLNEGYRNGYRVNTMRVFNLNGTELYTAFFRPSNSGEQYALGYSQTDFVNKYNQMFSAGYRLAQFDVYVNNNTPYYSGLFRPSSAGEYFNWGYTQTNFANLMNSRFTSGWSPNLMSVYVINGTPYYTGTFRQISSGMFYEIGYARIDMEYDQQNKNWALWGQGWRPAVMCAY